MNKRWRRRILWFTAFAGVLPFALYWAADTWMESSGGREMLEQALTDRIGMPTRIEGEFDLMLLPDIGVSGTRLVIGEQAPGSAFASSREFEVSVALKPLFDRNVEVEWIRLTGGQVDPGYYARSDGKGESETIQLPIVRELTVRDFQITLSRADQSNLQVKELKVSNFAENRETPFSLEIEDLVKVSGSLRWDTARSTVHLLKLELDLHGQKVSAEGCMVTTEPRSLNAAAQADVFDIDAFRKSLPPGGVKEGSGEGLPLEINAHLTVDELKSNGAIARGVLFSIGREPTAVCGTD